MITVITIDNLGRHAALYRNQFELRHRAFIDRQGYDVFDYDGMEFDRYDSPSTAYLVHSPDGHTVWGCSRLTKTTHGCMLADLWPDLVEDKALLKSETVWEGTRFCIDSTLNPDIRRSVCHEIACAYVEYAMRYDVRMVIGMMPTVILRSVFERSGIALDRLGPVRAIPKFSESASGWNTH